MLKALQSTWAAAVLGAVTFLGTLVVVWHQMPAMTPARTTVERPVRGPGFVLAANPEMDLLIADLRQRSLDLDAREAGLRELELRIQAQAAEITPITQEVARVMQLIDTLFVRIEESEVASLRRDAKRFSGMSPANAAAILQHLTDSEIIKILAHMNDRDSAALLGALATRGGDAPARVARLSEGLRRVVHPPTSPPTPGR